VEKPEGEIEPRETSVSESRNRVQFSHPDIFTAVIARSGKAGQRDWPPTAPTIAEIRSRAAKRSLWLWSNSRTQTLGHSGTLALWKSITTDTESVLNTGRESCTKILF